MSEDETHTKEQFRYIREELSKISQALITLAKLEERQVNYTRELNDLKKDVNGVYSRLNVLEAKVGVNITKVGFWEKFLWIIATAVISVFATLVSTNGI